MKLYIVLLIVACHVNFHILKSLAFGIKGFPFGIFGGKSRKQQRSQKFLECPLPNGLFPFVEDCSKFLNCHNGRPFLQSCGPGTLFNPYSLVCDHQRNVECLPVVEAETDISNHDLQPTSIKPQYKNKGNKGKKGKALEKPETTKANSQEKKSTFFGIPKVLKNVVKKAKTYAKGHHDQDKMCLQPTGQFPYPKDCSKFVNCWKGRATLSHCSLGTVFDASTQQCNWPGKAICATTSKASVSVEEPKVKIPYSGQHMRLVRGGEPYVGYLQVYKDGNWHPVIVEEETWSTTSKICNELGYSSGVHSETRGLVYGWPDRRQLREPTLVCGPEETNPVECRTKLLHFDKLATSVVGIRCRRNSVSECPPKWQRWGKKCYYAQKTQLKTQTEASQACQAENARLLSITYQEENDFISHLLSSLGLSDAEFHTSGITFVLQHQQYWLWQNSPTPLAKSLDYTKWWPGWESANFSASETKLGMTDDSSCIVLDDTFPLPDDPKTTYSTKYYYWKLDDCNQPLRFVCEREPLDVGCIIGRGENYEGSANVTANGVPCLPWDSLGSIYRGLSQTRELRENFCSNPDGDDLPWCYVQGRTTEFCDIPRCPYKESLRVEEEQSGCDPGSFKCKTGECIHLEWVCDGQEDCSEGDEEEGCPNYSDVFEKNNGLRLTGSEIEKWVFTPKPTCGIRCVQAKSFVCHSFNYEESTSTCILNQNNARAVGGLQQDSNWEYHERIDLAIDCTNFFVCQDYKCIPHEQICDGHRDCTGGEDESDCVDTNNFQVRLVNGSGPHEGNVEVKVGDRWGIVCDDMWGLEDGHVLCRELGYHRGAMKTYTNSFFGRIQKPFLMDDLNCNGKEESISLCNFGGWGNSDCSANEAAGVTCYQKGDVCAKGQWSCDNGRCIDFSYYCDQINDCGDESDERQQNCMSPVTVRLNNGESTGKSLGGGSYSSTEFPSEGRVEVRYKGIWGTVCDDDISVEEGHVICRMMGWKGVASVFKNNSFGSGSGPIWIDNLRCRGSEATVEECHHERWGSSNCDHNEDLGLRCTNDVQDKEKVVLRTEPPFSAHPSENLPSKCGTRYVEDSPKEVLASARVVDGFVPERGSQPWMAGLRRKTSFGSTHECGAFILSEDLVMTAAHCLWKYSISEYVIRTGDYNNEEKDIYEQEWLLENIIVHPYFDKGVLFNNDLGLMKIKRKNGKGIRFNERVQPICLVPNEFQYPVGLNCTVAGWGSMSTTSAYSRILQSTLLPILSDSECREDHVYGPTRISHGMFCAGYMEGGIDTCQGDSGGPLVCQVEGKFTAVGITSWGHGCARANKPGVYTKLTYYLDWIYNVTDVIDL